MTPYRNLLGILGWMSASLSIGLASVSYAANDSDWDSISARCETPSAAEPVLYQTDFDWGYSAKAMDQRFEEVYASGKRLAKRAYYDTAKKKFILPFYPEQGGDVVLSKRLIQNVRRHIEEALERSYVQNIFFPDMGHSHFFIPSKSWKEKYNNYPINQFAQMYSDLLNDPELKVLYHTAEQLKMLDEKQQVLPDRETQWRFYTRNLVGDNSGLGRLEIHRNLEQSANTVRDAEGYEYWGSGFNVSASKDGCFPYSYKGKTYYFDLSLYDLPPVPAAN